MFVERKFRLLTARARFRAMPDIRFGCVARQCAMPAVTALQLFRQQQQQPRVDMDMDSVSTLKQCVKNAINVLETRFNCRVYTEKSANSAGHAQPIFTTQSPAVLEI